MKARDLSVGDGFTVEGREGTFELLSRRVSGHLRCRPLAEGAEEEDLDPAAEVTPVRNRWGPSAREPGTRPVRG